MKKAFKSSDLIWIGVVSFVGIFLIPFLNTISPESIFHVSNFRITVFGKYLCYAVLALSVNLLWGYTGLLSLGQALFFSLGGYALGMHLMLMIGKLGQYKAEIPDFMVFLEFATRFPETGGLPPHWIPFKNFWFAAAAVKYTLGRNGIQEWN